MNRGEQILDWCAATFGDLARDKHERAARLVEEALELGQASGISIAEVLRTAARVYERPPGDHRREIDQVGLTLEVLAANIGYDLDAGIQREFDRIQSIPRDEWKKRHAAKAALGIAIYK